jgi:hypothetical protein
MAEKEPEVAALLARSYIGMSESYLNLTRKGRRKLEKGES